MSARWQIRKDRLDAMPTWERIKRPWILYGPSPACPSWTVTELFESLDLLWHARTFDGDHGALLGEFARFPTFRAACAAVASYRPVVS